MWPKMLIELLPHLSRLVPMWDKFLSSKAANESAMESVVAASDGMRKSLNEVSEAHGSLYRQIQEQGAKTNEQIAALEQELQSVRIMTERLEAAVRQTDARVVALTAWIKGGAIATVLLLVVLVALVLLHHGA